MTYCSVNQVRLVSGLESNQITDADIRDIRDEVATSELNDDINQKVQDEKLNVTISGEKENDIDGSNKTFYLQGTHKSELQVGDRNNDGTVDSTDLNVYQIVDNDNDGTDERVTNLNVTLDDREIGKLTVEDSSNNALEEGDVFVSYELAPLDEDGYGTDFSSGGPAKQIETACAQLTAAYCFTNIEAAKLKDFDIGNVSINTQSEGAQIMRSEYRDTVRRINQTQVIQSGQNVNSVSGALKGGIRNV